MSSSIPSVALLAKAILCLSKGEPLPSIIADALRELCPEPVSDAEPVAEPVADPIPEQVTPVKEKKVRKISKAVAAEASTPAPAPASAPASAPAPAVDAVTATNDWRKHPSRLQTIDSTRCTGRRIDTENPLIGTRAGDDGSNGMIFPEKQCTRKPSPGSKLCAGCATKDAEYKADPSKNNASWQGRLDEETLYPRAKIVGSELFLKRYPKGIPTTAAVAPVAAPVAPVAAATKTKTKKAAAVAVAVAATTVAADVAPVEALWSSFQHEGRTHIRNLKNNKVYFANLSANSPEENAVKEQYVGRWVDGDVELVGDSDDDE